MDNLMLFPAIIAVTLAVVTFQAWRIGNDRRDVTLLGVVGALFGLGTVVAALA